ncbi:MAG: hypothetical protein ABI461_16475, partial [Polyangiaceae bacterium]
PSGTGRVLTVVVDLSARTGKAAPLTSVTGMAGNAVAQVDSEAEVRSSTGSAYYLAENKLILRIDRASDVTIQ